jgi:hyperosmotically inducible protein
MFRRIVLGAALLLALHAAPASADDANLQLFKDVQKQVLGYSYFSIFDMVHMQVDNGVVELTGKVTMPYKKSALEERVMRVTGVRQLRNNIEVLPVSQFDDSLRLRIARAIYGHSNFWGYGSMVNPPIHIIVERGRVTLDGVVNNNVDRMLARSIASGFTSLGPIQNNLKTDAEVKEDLEKL